MTGPDLTDKGRHLAELLDTMRAAQPMNAEFQAAATEFSSELAKLLGQSARLKVHWAQAARSRAALETDRASWRQLFDLAPDPYMVTDPAGFIIDVNQRAAALFTVSPAARQSLVLRFAAECRTEIQRTLRDPQAASDPIVVRLADNPRFRGELRCVPIGTDRLLWLLRDVSEAESAREALRAAVDREREAADRMRAVDSMRQAFLLAASHDLRSPLAAIAGLATLLADIPVDDEQRSLTINRLQRTAAETIAMLDNLLDYERIDSESPRLQAESVELGPIVAAAAESVPADSHKLEFDIQMTRAQVDVTLVERIVANLVANAVQHTPGGSTIWVRCSPQPDGVLLVVDDDGSGVPREQREQIFELFERGTDAIGGLGVGLALVRRFARLHGGFARVEDRLGGGASFQVLLAQQPTASPD
jgi:signal transduction histidine kinase